MSSPSPPPEAPRSPAEAAMLAALHAAARGPPLRAPASPTPGALSSSAAAAPAPPLDPALLLTRFLRRRGSDPAALAAGVGEPAAADWEAGAAPRAARAAGPAAAAGVAAAPSPATVRRILARFPMADEDTVRGLLKLHKGRRRTVEAELASEFAVAARVARRSARAETRRAAAEAAAVTEQPLSVAARLARAPSFPLRRRRIAQVVAAAAAVESAGGGGDPELPAAPLYSPGLTRAVHSGDPPVDVVRQSTSTTRGTSELSPSRDAYSSSSSSSSSTSSSGSSSGSDAELEAGLSPPGRVAGADSAEDASESESEPSGVLGSLLSGGEGVPWRARREQRRRRCGQRRKRQSSALTLPTVAAPSFLNPNGGPSPSPPGGGLSWRRRRGGSLSSVPTSRSVGGDVGAEGFDVSNGGVGPVVPAIVLNEKMSCDALQSESESPCCEQAVAARAAAAASSQQAGYVQVSGSGKDSKATSTTITSSNASGPSAPSVASSPANSPVSRTADDPALRSPLLLIDVGANGDNEGADSSEAVSGRGLDATAGLELRALAQYVEEIEAAHAKFVRQARAREDVLIANLSATQAQLDLLEQHQKRRYDDITETYHENYNAVGLVDARLDELSAQMVQRNLRRRRFMWNRIGWFLVDGLAWLVWIVVWVGTRIFRLLARPSEHRMFSEGIRYRVRA